MNHNCYINSISSIAVEPTDTNRFAVIEPDYKTLITNAILRRRMSRIIKMGVACALDCISQAPLPQIDAIITATGWGCLADTEKFLNIFLDNESMLTPTAFIQSTFNTIGGQIALFNDHNHAYNLTYVHRSFSFENALLDALMRLEEGDKQVLVGAMDEITDSQYQIINRFACWKEHAAGEGAQFFILGTECNAQTYAQVLGTLTFVQSDAEVVKKRIAQFLGLHQLTLGDVSVYEGSEFKKRCGEYPTASSFAMYEVAQNLKAGNGEAYTLIYNKKEDNHAFILIKALR